MSSANLWCSGFFMVSLLDTRVSPYVASPLVVVYLNSYSRMESEFSRGRETRTSRYSLVGAFRSIRSPHIRSIVGPEQGRVEGR